MFRKTRDQISQNLTEKLNSIKKTLAANVEGDGPIEINNTILYNQKLISKLFGKNGLMEEIARLKGLGTSEFAKLVSEIHKLKNNLCKGDVLGSLDGLNSDLNLTDALGAVMKDYKSKSDKLTSQLNSTMNQLNDYVEKRTNEKVKLYADTDRVEKYRYPFIRLCPICWCDDFLGERMWCVLLKDNRLYIDYEVINSGNYFKRKQDNLKPHMEDIMKIKKELKSLYDKTFDSFAKTNVALCKAQSKAVTSYMNFFASLRKLCEGYINKKLHGKKLDDVIRNSDNYRSEDILKLKFAQLCTRFKYSAPKDEELKSLTKKVIEEKFPELIKNKLYPTDGFMQEGQNQYPYYGGEDTNPYAGI